MKSRLIRTAALFFGGCIVHQVYKSHKMSKKMRELPTTMETSGNESIYKYREIKGNIFKNQVEELSDHQKQHFGISVMKLNQSLTNLKAMVQVTLMEKEKEMAKVMRQLVAGEFERGDEPKLKERLGKLEKEVRQLKEYEAIYTKKKNYVVLKDSDFDQ